MKKVFICSPYGGKQSNIEKAKDYCRYAVSQGFIPIAPHVYFTQFLCENRPLERTMGIEMGIELMKLCDEFWLFGNVISAGMQKELDSWHGVVRQFPEKIIL